jgi:hypothetical protein
MHDRHMLGARATRAEGYRLPSIQGAASKIRKHPNKDMPRRPDRCQRLLAPAGEHAIRSFVVR